MTDVGYAHVQRARFDSEWHPVVSPPQQLECTNHLVGLKSKLLERQCLQYVAACTSAHLTHRIANPVLRPVVGGNQAERRAGTRSHAMAAPSIVLPYFQVAAARVEQGERSRNKLFCQR